MLHYIMKHIMLLCEKLFSAAVIAPNTAACPSTHSRVIMSLSYCPTFLVRIRRWLSAFRFDCLSCCDALPSICYPLSLPLSLPPLLLTLSLSLSPSLNISPVSFTLSLPTPWSIQISLPRLQNYLCKTYMEHLHNVPCYTTAPKAGLHSSIPALHP